MREVSRSHHKQRKWVCPNCRKTRRSRGRYQRRSDTVHDGDERN
jgi:hypothetical protein